MKYFIRGLFLVVVMFAMLDLIKEAKTMPNSYKAGVDVACGDLCR